jgi:hypothetical protein
MVSFCVIYRYFHAEAVRLLVTNIWISPAVSGTITAENAHGGYRKYLHFVSYLWYNIIVETECGDLRAAPRESFGKEKHK